MTFKQDWEKTDQHYSISPQAIEGMVALAFPQSKLISHEVISGGCANLNIKITLQGEPQPYCKWQRNTAPVDSGVEA